LEHEEIIRKVNAIQILLEAIADELIEKNIIEEQNILKRLDSLDDEINEINSMIYFGPTGEA
jgi:hypothetical protein